ncbi:DUF2958 domain-containing protein [Arcobacter arenosus]|uniref:DUF2958 domain-containing protein n=1 Tax=Arcobacter arenosus TaxID=2576037 RepID=UPI003BAC399C
MELIPNEIKEKIPKLYDTEDISDPIVHIKLFLDGWTWYIIELSINDDICFGYVVSPYESELGYFSLEELKSLRGRLGTWLERDLFFKPTPLSKIKKERR